MPIDLDMSALLRLAILVLAAANIATLVAWTARRAGMLDHPNVRSSHENPTPRAGGLGIIAGAGALLLAAPLLAGFDPAALRPAGIAAMAMAAFGALGLADDLYGLGPRFKFAAMAVLSLAFAALAGPAVAIDFTAGFGVILPWPVALLGSALWIFVVVNAVNFMDGSDGLIALSLMMAGAGFAALGWLAGSSAVLLTGLALLAAMAGFYVLNGATASRRGGVFAGDCGALGAGALAAMCGLTLANEGPAGTVWLAPVLLMPLLGDVLLTLARRAMGGRLSLSAHREHAYQRLLVAGASHHGVAQIWMLLSAGCVVIAIVSAQGGPETKLAGFVFTALIAVTLYARAGAQADRP